MECPEEDNEAAEAKNWGSASGKTLDPANVKAARNEELTFIERTPVYEVVGVEEAWRNTCKQPTGTRRVDIDKRRGSL